MKNIVKTTVTKTLQEIDGVQHIMSVTIDGLKPSKDTFPIFKIEPDDKNESAWKVIPYYFDKWQYAYHFNPMRDNSLKLDALIDQLVKDYEKGRIKTPVHNHLVSNAISYSINHPEAKRLLTFERNARTTPGSIPINPTLIDDYVDFGDYIIETYRSRNGHYDKQSYTVLTFSSGTMRWVKKALRKRL